MGITSSLRKLARATSKADINKIAKELKKDPNVDNKLIDEVAEAANLSLREKRVQFKKDYTVEEATRTGRSGFSDTAEYEVERGMAGEVREGERSMPRMDEAASKGSRKRSARVAELETKAEKGEITKKEQAELDRLDALSEEQDIARVEAASKTRRDKAAKERGVSLMGMEGIERVGAKAKYKASELIGNNTNGIVRETGEVLGNPTPNQVQMAIRDLEARTRLSAEAKRNLAKLKRLTPQQKTAMKRRQTERRMEEKAQDLETRRGPRPMKRGGLVRKGHVDMRSKGLFY